MKCDNMDNTKNCGLYFHCDPLKKCDDIIMTRVMK